MSDQLHAQVSELTSGHTNRQAHEVGEGAAKTTRYHRTYVPALIDQLDQATSSDGGVGGTGGPASRPAAWLEPLDTLAWIDERASNWLWRLNDRDRLDDTKLKIRRLHGLWAGQDEAAKKRIERDVRTWYVQARIVTGWDSSAFRPDNTCPICSERRALRIKIVDQLAFCTECRETWDASTLSLLAAHIKAENGESDDDGEAA